MDATAGSESACRYCDESAATWDTERQACYSDSVRRHAVQMGKYVSDDIVLDCGAGSGDLTEALLDVGVRRVIAADVTANLLLVLGRRFGNRVEQRLTFGGRISLGDAAVDGIVWNGVLHHLDDLAKFSSKQPGF